MGTTKSKDKSTLNIFLEYVAQGSISLLLEKYFIYIFYSNFNFYFKKN